MADQWYGTPSGGGERWNVNLPAVVGVVFVFLLGVVIWVVATSGDGDAIETAGTGASTLPSSIATTVPPSTSPQPMPVTTAPPAPPPPTAASTVPLTVPPTAAPATQAPTPTTTAAPTTVATTVSTTTAPTTTVAPLPGNGDLGVPGHPIQKPPCDGGYITVIASAVGDEATPAGIGQVLDRYTGSSYLRTDQTCPSLTPSIDGEPIYVVYLGPFPLDADACRARSQGPSGSYVRRLSTDLDPSHSVACA